MTPEAQFSKPPPLAPELVRAFPRRGLWRMAGLTVITLLAYPYYWMYRRTLILNRMPGVRPVAPGLVWSSLALAALGYVVTFAQLGGGDEGLERLGLPVVIADAGVFLVWAFTFRARLMLALGITMRDRRWMKGIWTFLFSAFYFQYKLNRYHRAVDAP